MLAFSLDRLDMFDTLDNHFPKGKVSPFRAFYLACPIFQKEGAFWGQWALGAAGALGQTGLPTVPDQLEMKFQHPTGRHLQAEKFLGFGSGTFWGD
jgi:hypothetical protein